MSPFFNTNGSQVNLPDGASARFMTTLGRGIQRHCPYCGGSGIFRNWFSLKDACPECKTVFAKEDGYFLGSYPLNLVLTSLIAIAVMLYMFAGTDTTVIQKQIVVVILAVGVPLVLFPFTLSLWMAIDLTIHSPHHPDQEHHHQS